MSAAPPPHTLRARLPDGRTITGLEVGDPAGRPVLHFHGTPSSSVEVLGLGAIAAEAGVRLLGLDRPGIGGSTPAGRRPVRAWAADAAAVAADLHLDRPAVIGYSGGGPYALACALEPPGTSRFGPVAVVAGAPPVENRADLRAMDPADRALTFLGRHAPVVGSAVVGVSGRVIRLSPRLALRLWEVGLPRVDRRALRAPGGPGRELMSDLGRILATSGRGVIEDERTLAAPWGFAAEDVVAPIRWWHGRDDVLVALEHVEPFVARLPGASVVRVPDAGHLLLAGVLPEVLATLA